MYVLSSGNVELTDILTGLCEMQPKEKLTNYSSFSAHFKIYFSFSTQTDTVRTTKLQLELM